MYIDNSQQKAKVGRVSIDVKENRIRIRFTYPKGKRNDFYAGEPSNRNWQRAIATAQTIDNDIYLGLKSVKELPLPLLYKTVREPFNSYRSSIKRLFVNSTSLNHGWDISLQALMASLKPGERALTDVLSVLGKNY